MKQAAIRAGKIRGFALPTVLIASIVMLVVLLSGLAAVSAISQGLDQQYTAMLSKTASESGLAMAKSCAALNGGTITWTNSTPLKPNTNCNGAETLSCPNTSTDPKCYVLKDGNFRTTFRVGVVTDSGGNATDITVEGIVRQVRKTSGQVIRQEFNSAKTSIKDSITFSSVLGQRSIASAYNFSCAIGTDSEAYCWGNNGVGQLGDGTTTNRLTPVHVARGAIPAGVTIDSISAKHNHTCVVGSDGEAYCWGNNTNGGLGNNTTTNSSVPVAVAQGAIPAGVTLKSVSAGEYYSCAVGSDNKAYCWGYNPSGQLGNNTTTQSLVPVAVAQGAIPAGVTIKGITTGYGVTCALGSDNKGYCWGYNNYGGVGDGTTTNRLTPVALAQGAIPAGVTLRGIAAGDQGACAIGSDFKAYCWGYNTDGSVGDNTTTHRSSPVAVAQGAIPAGVTILGLMKGYDQTCAVGSDFEGYCWGYNTYGLLGDNTTTNRLTPVAVVQGAVPAGVTIKAISSGYVHTCAIGSDANTYCWGNNTYGSLGNNTTTNSSSPVAVARGLVPSGITLGGPSNLTY